MSAPPAMPTARQPRAFASWPTALPTAPLAALTTIVCPGFGSQIARRRRIGCSTVSIGSSQSTA